MADTKGPLVYLREQFGSKFLNEYKLLDEKDKETLKQWATEEMIAIGR